MHMPMIMRAVMACALVCIATAAPLKDAIAASPPATNRNANDASALPSHAIAASPATHRNANDASALLSHPIAASPATHRNANDASALLSHPIEHGVAVGRARRGGCSFWDVQCKLWAAIRARAAAKLQAYVAQQAQARAAKAQAAKAHAEAAKAQAAKAQAAKAQAAKEAAKAAAKEAAEAAFNKMRFQKITKGTCESAGLAPIDDDAICKKAAAKLGHKIVSFDNRGYPDIPRGYSPEIPQGCTVRNVALLFRNPAWSTTPCSTDKTCICSEPEMCIRYWLFIRYWSKEC